MNTDYMYANDMILAITEEVSVMFHTTIATRNNNNKVYYNYNEYKINNYNVCNTMIKRSIVYYLYIEDRRGIKAEKIQIYTDNVYDFLSKMKYAIDNWINDTKMIYGYLDSGLNVINDENVYIRLPFNKIISIKPGVVKTEAGMFKCIDMYLNSSDPVKVSFERFQNMYHLLSNLDMIGYANTTMTGVMLMNTVTNRTDFSRREVGYSEPKQTDTISAPEGRVFSSKQEEGSLLT